MTFDPTKPHKNIDGVNINLTDEEIAEIIAYVPDLPIAPIPNLSVQLTSILIAKGVIEKTDIHPETLLAMNIELIKTE